ncbi:MAG: hypothetical protein H6626_11255 [Pseudobdellovibrionaceae bacterium]|nr:MAG: hypothetical protein H6626_11255 [Pseudobdellovibrionaceae bacterium]
MTRRNDRMQESNSSKWVNMIDPKLSTPKRIELRQKASDGIMKFSLVDSLTLVHINLGPYQIETLDQNFYG